MKLLTAIIYSENGMLVDIFDMVEEVVFYESLQSNTITGSVIMIDTANLPETLPFLGREILGISYNASTEESGKFVENTLSFDILALKNMTPRNTESKTYSLEIATRPTLFNNTLSLNKRYFGSTSNIVTDILTNDMLLSPDYLEVQETLGGISFIAPNVSPFQMINYLADNSYEEDSTFYFFETNKRFCFKSLNAMAEEDEVMTFNYGENTGGVRHNTLRILDYTASLRFDLLTNLKNGQYASSIVSHDILHKRLINTKYEATKYLSYRASYSPESRRVLDAKSITDNNPQHQRDSERAALNNDKTLIEITGNSIIEVGKNIVINLPSSLSVRHKAPDAMLSGKFLVTKIKHILTREGYHMVVQVNRND